MAWDNKCSRSARILPPLQGTFRGVFVNPCGNQTDPLPNQHHNKRELPEQKPARGMRAGCPSLRSLQDLRQCPVHFSVKLESGIGALLQVPVKGGVIFGSGFFVKLRRISGHRAALPNCACGLPPMNWSLPCQSPGPPVAFRSPLPKPVERLGRPCPRGWKSANPPTLPVPQPRATTPALTTCKLPLSSASCSPR
jgi:hypothetical protein